MSQYLNHTLFPTPPLKFRTSGFPQYGFKLELHRNLRHRQHNLNARYIYITLTMTYMRLKPWSLSLLPLRTIFRFYCNDLSSPETLGSPVGYVVLLSLRLLWSHPRLSFLLLPYFLRPASLCPTTSYGLVTRASPICSAYLFHRAIFRTPAL